MSYMLVVGDKDGKVLYIYHILKWTICLGVQFYVS